MNSFETSDVSLIFCIFHWEFLHIYLNILYNEIYFYSLAIDDGHDLDRDMLVGIYERIKTNEFKMGSDHVTQVLKVQQTIVGKKPVSFNIITFV